MNGKNLIVFAGGYPIAAAKSCSLNTTCSTLEIAPPTDGSWKAFMADRKEWNITCNYLLGYNNNPPYDSIRNALAVGVSVTLKFISVYDETYEFYGMYNGSVSTNVIRDSISFIYYSTQEKCFVAYKNGTYYKYWDDETHDWSMFQNPRTGVNYKCFQSQQYYEWKIETTPLVLMTALTGSAICTKCQFNGTVQSLAKGSFEFKGNGALSLVTE